MMEQPLRRAPARQGHPERVEREVVRDALVHRRADGEARTEIEDHRQIEPPLARRNVGDVGDPRLVRSGTLELPRQNVGGDGKQMLRLRRDPKPQAAPGGQPAHQHEPRHTLATRPAPALPELRVNPGAPVASRSSCFRR